MSIVSTTRELVMGVSPGERPNARLVAAVCHAGGLGVLDLGRGGPDQGGRWAVGALEQLADEMTGTFAVRVPAVGGLDPAVLDRAAGRVDTVVLGVDSPWSVADLAGRYRVLAEVTDLDDADAAAAAGAHGLIARGTEAGGRVGDLSTFVLLQRLLGPGAPALPVW